jgi:hypothetical protein
MPLLNRVAMHLSGKPQASDLANGTATPPSPPNGYGAPKAPRKKKNATARAGKPKSATPRGGRNPKTGRFAAGNKVAAWHVNPMARARAELQKALVAAVSTNDVAAVAKRLRDDALRGHVASAELLLKYVIGKPAKAEDPDRVELEAWKLVQSWPILAELVVAMTRGVNPELAADVAGHVAVAGLDKLSKRIEDAEDDCDAWGNPYIAKQTDAVLGRRLTKGN